MGINRIFETLSKVIDAGNQEQKRSETITPTFVPLSETTSTEKRTEQQFYGDYQRNQIEMRWAKQQTQDVSPFQSVFPKISDTKYAPVDTERLQGAAGDDIAKFLSSKEFSQLDATVQESIKKSLESVKDNSLSVKNLIELIKSGGFRAASKKLQSAMLNSLAKRPEDKIYLRHCRKRSGAMISKNSSKINKRRSSKIWTNLPKRRVTKATRQQN